VDDGTRGCALRKLKIGTGYTSTPWLLAPTAPNRCC